MQPNKVTTLARKQARAGKYATSATLTITRHVGTDTVCAAPSACQAAHYMQEVSK